MSARLLAIVLTVLSGCSLKHMTVDQTAAVLKDAGQAFDSETDLELAAAALPASLKTAEGFLRAHPTQRDLLAIVAQGYMNYAFGFLEDEAEALSDSDPQRSRALKARALGLYLRSRVFALRLLALDHPELAQALTAGDTPSLEALAKVNRASLPGLFWTANSWGAAIDADKSAPAMLSQLPIVKLLMERCVQIDETYFYAGPHLVLAALAAGLPKALGGDEETAQKHFDRALELTQGKHLMTRVIYARVMGLQRSDRAFFEKTLGEVLAADPDADPSLALANRLAKRRAQRYLAHADDLFI